MGRISELILERSGDGVEYVHTRRNKRWAEHANHVQELLLGSCCSSKPYRSPYLAFRRCYQTSVRMLGHEIQKRDSESISLDSKHKHAHKDKDKEKPS
jgi:hypothetical protein